MVAVRRRHARRLREIQVLRLTGARRVLRRCLAGCWGILTVIGDVLRVRMRSVEITPQRRSLKDLAEHLIDFLTEFLARDNINVEFNDRIDQCQHAQDEIDVRRFQVLGQTRTSRPTARFNVDVDAGDTVRGQKDAAGRQRNGRFVAHGFLGDLRCGHRFVQRLTQRFVRRGMAVPIVIVGHR